MQLGARYTGDRRLPDKAIDLIDEAASRVRIAIDSKPEALDVVSRRAMQLKIEREALRASPDRASQERLHKLEAELTEAEREEASMEEAWRASQQRQRRSALSARQLAPSPPYPHPALLRKRGRVGVGVRAGTVGALHMPTSECIEP